MSQWDLLKEEDETEGRVGLELKSVPLPSRPNQKEYREFLTEFCLNDEGAASVSCYCQWKLAQAAVVELELRQIPRRESRREPPGSDPDDPSGLTGSDLERWLKENEGVVVQLSSGDETYKVYFDSDRFLFKSRLDSYWHSCGHLRDTICLGISPNQARSNR